MTTRVFYDSWQMQCCGVPFAVGERVSWTAISADPQEFQEFGPLRSAGIEWREEHHQAEGEQVEKLEGEVAGITAVWQKYFPGHEYVPGVQSAGVSTPVIGDILTSEIDRANGWDEDREPTAAGHSFSGYIVALK